MREIKLATCSYRGFHPSMGIPVRTSVGKPKHRLGYRLDAEARSLFPTYKMLKLPYDEYRYQYLSHLRAKGVVHFEKIFRSLLTIYQRYGDRLVLLCYEDVIGEGDWCHRRMFSEFWQGTGGCMVPELYLNLQTGELEEHLDTPGDHPPKMAGQDVSLF